MHKYNFIIALRGLWRDKITTIVNITGLSLAFIAFILIVQYVKFEKSYDYFHKDAENIYMIGIERTLENGNIEKSAYSYCPLKLKLDDEISEIEYSSRSHPEQGVFTTEDKKSFRLKCNWVDPEFLNIFNISLIYGNKKTALNQTHTVILSESVAEKIFGDKNPVGETLLLSGEHLFTVTGVYEDLPENTHLDLEVLPSWATIDEKWKGMNTSWSCKLVYTYIKLSENADTKKLLEKINRLIEKNLPSNSKFQVSAILQPVTEIHLNPQLDTGIEDKGVEGNINILSIVAFSLLALAWLNNANLFAAQSAGQFQDAIKYISMGAKPRSLFSKFFIQIAIVNLVAIIISLAVIYFSYPFIRLYISGFDFLRPNDIFFWLQLFVLTTIGITACSVYPFLVFYSGRRRTINKKQSDSLFKRHITREILIGVQIAISLILTAGYLIINEQVSFMQNQKLGMNIKHKLILTGPNADKLFENAKIQNAFRSELEKELNIDKIAISGSVPGKELSTKMSFCKGKVFSEEKKINISTDDVNNNFFSLYEINFIAGRDFDTNKFNEDSTCIVNLKALKKLGFGDADEALGQEIVLGGGFIKTIVGIVNDVHHLSLKNEKQPIVYLYWKKSWRWIRIDYFTIPVETENIQTVINKTKKKWKVFFPDEPFVYFFLDDFFNKQYEEETRFKRFFVFFSTFAIIIIAIGLFSLARFIVKKRSKELGVRKVNGAKTQQLIFMILKDYFIVFFIALLIAIPLSIYLISLWLEIFPYKIEIKASTYILSTLFIAITIIIMVAAGTYKTANQNPVKSLKDE